MKVMKVITVIELLDKISNDESVPQKIKYDGIIYEYKPRVQDYYSCDRYLFGDTLFVQDGICGILNDVVEIIEEEEKKIEKVGLRKDGLFRVASRLELTSKVNEIIDVINEEMK